MTGPVDDWSLPPELATRIRALEGVARDFGRGDWARLEATVRSLQGRPTAWIADERFWFSGKAGIDFTPGENKAFRKLWTRMNGGLAYSVTGREAVDSVRTVRGIDWIERHFVSEDMRIEGSAGTVIERSVQGSPWLAVIGVWNAFCAALMPDRLGPELVAALELAWREAITLTPREELEV